MWFVVKNQAYRLHSPFRSHDNLQGTDFLDSFGIFNLIIYLLLKFVGGMLLGRTLSILLTMTIGTSMAARQGPTAMAAHQICLQVWLAVSLLADALAVSAQVSFFCFRNHLLF
jgi:Na+-driven multidrug efflux pump